MRLRRGSIELSRRKGMQVIKAEYYINGTGKDFCRSFTELVANAYTLSSYRFNKFDSGLTKSQVAYAKRKCMNILRAL